jgi:hypothetical protein
VVSSAAILRMTLQVNTGVSLRCRVDAISVNAPRGPLINIESRQQYSLFGVRNGRGAFKPPKQTQPQA